MAREQVTCALRACPLFPQEQTSSGCMLGSVWCPKADITTLPGTPALLPGSARGDGGSVVRLVPGRASLRPSQVPAQDSAERPLPKQGRQAWEAEEELEEELEGVLFATPERPAREDLDVGCWKSSAVGCWKSSAAASPDSAGSSPAPSARRVDGLFFSNPPVGLRSSA
jgi:hypothetical protein